jgi:hypothetical protein
LYKNYEGIVNVSYVNEKKKKLITHSPYHMRVKHIWCRSHSMWKGECVKSVFVTLPYFNNWSQGISLIDCLHDALVFFFLLRESLWVSVVSQGRVASRLLPLDKGLLLAFWGYGVILSLHGVNQLRLCLSQLLGLWSFVLPSRFGGGCSFPNPYCVMVFFFSSFFLVCSSLFR